MILRTFDRRCLGTEIGPQRIARSRRKTEAVGCDVEIEVVDAATILYRIDNAQAGDKTKDFKVFDVSEVMRLESGLIEQEFDFDRMAVRHRTFAVDQFESGLIEKLGSFPQPAAVLPRTIGNRRHIRFTKNLVRYLAAERLK